MYQKLLDIDPLTGAAEMFYYDEDTGRCMIDRQVDVEPLLELNKARYNSFDERTPFGAEPIHHVASIPMEVLEVFKQETGINPYHRLEGDEKRRFDRWLDDSANRLFRTRPGKLSQ